MNNLPAFSETTFFAGPPDADADATTTHLAVGRDRIRDEWMEIGDRLRRRWRKLTQDDIAFHDGSAEYLAAVLQDRYGIDRREALLQVYEFEAEL